jgi:hypothetical protein
VAEETGSFLEAQEALDHENQATTRVYVQRITVKKDRHGRKDTERRKLRWVEGERVSKLEATARGAHPFTVEGLLTPLSFVQFVRVGLSPLMCQGETCTVRASYQP